MDYVPGVNCTLPAFDHFPTDLFSESARSHGAILIHILVVVYLFISLAIVCDDYFVASLGKICEILGFSEDVAGATFMAAGSSAPELFTSIIGVFVSKGDVGTGTIVGSAVFNILVIIGLCSILAGKIIYLNWWPIIRDSGFYATAIIALIIVMADGAVTWIDSLFMLSLYAVYIYIMKNNSRFQKWAYLKTEHIVSLPRNNTGPSEQTSGKSRSEYSEINTAVTEAMIDNENRNIDMEAGYQRQPYKPPTIPRVDKKVQAERREQLMNCLIVMRSPQAKVDFFELVFLLQTGRKFRAKTRLIAASKLLIVQRKKLIREGKLTAVPPLDKRANFRSRSFSRALTQDDPDSPNFEKWKGKPPLSEVGYLNVAKWAFMLPIHYGFFFTIPDCRKTAWERYYMATFFMSIAWIAVLSYIMVWMVTIVGHTIGIPETIMGITFLAAGTSIPDCMASVIVAKQGQGDMAVSNSIGSNVFDILLGLAAPWFLQTAIVSPGSVVKINSNGLVVSVVLLFLTVAFLIIGVYRQKWQLNRRFGWYCLSMYVGFVIISCMVEANVFGYVNPPVCPA